MALVSYFQREGSENLIIKNYNETKDTVTYDDDTLRIVYDVFFRNQKLNEALIIIERKLVNPTLYDNYARAEILLQNNEILRGLCELANIAKLLQAAYNIDPGKMPENDKTLLEKCYFSLALATDDDDKRCCYADQCLVINSENTYARLMSISYKVKVDNIALFTEFKKHIMKIIESGNSELIGNYCYDLIKKIYFIEKEFQQFHMKYIDPLMKNNIYKKVRIDPIKKYNNNTLNNPIDRNLTWRCRSLNSSSIFPSWSVLIEPVKNSILPSTTKKPLEKLLHWQNAKQNPLTGLTLWRHSQVKSSVIDNKIIFEPCMKPNN